MPIAIKQSIAGKYESVSSPHPSRSVLKRGLENELIYNENGDRVRKQKLMFTKHIEDIYIEWCHENENLINQELIIKGKKGVDYGYFCQCRPLHIVKVNYVLLMCYDECTGFNWLRQAIDEEISLNHECIEDCPVCKMCNVKNFDLLNRICCENANHAYLPKYNCASRLCSRCRHSGCYSIFRDPQLLKTSEGKLFSYKCIQQNQKLTKKKK